MGVRVGLLLLFVLGISWICDARQLVTLALNEGLDAPEISKNDRVCTLCEEFATEAIGYLSENKTQTEVLDMLHNTCSRVRNFARECVTLVDYYAPLFFLEVSSVEPEYFCKRVNLCGQIAILNSKGRENTCQICQVAVSEVLAKLKDPDTEIEVIEVLLKACNSMEGYAKKCKKIVFEYGPLILAKSEKFLETTDVCTMLRACSSSTHTTTTTNQASESTIKQVEAVAYE